jgi:hypothetical protein
MCIFLPQSLDRRQKKFETVGELTNCGMIFAEREREREREREK